MNLFSYFKKKNLTLLKIIFYPKLLHKTQLKRFMIFKKQNDNLEGTFI